MPTTATTKPTPKRAKRTVNYLHLLNRVCNAPLLLEPRYHKPMVDYLGTRMGVDFQIQIDAATLKAANEAGDSEASRNFVEVPNHIACIDVSGPLVRRASGLDAWCGIMSYQSIEQDYTEALNDDSKQAILMLFDSPGGEVGGCPDLADLIYSNRGKKPVYAAVSEMAFSAGYWLASACDWICVSRTAGVGSIGVFSAHCDQSSYDEKTGIKITYVFAGAKKVEGNPHEALSSDARSTIQSEVDRIYSLFSSAVARNREISDKKVRNTEAGVYFGQDAIDAGLADEVGTVSYALEALQSKIDENKSPKTTSSTRKATRPSPGQPASVAKATSADAEIQIEEEDYMPAIAPHKTATSDAEWDGPANEKRLKDDQEASYYRGEYAWVDPDGDETKKGAYKFPHHEVSESGDVGSANIKACESIIGSLNGARGGAKIPDSDREGVHRHAAKHIRDSGGEPADLKSLADLAVERYADSQQVPVSSGAAAPAPDAAQSNTLSKEKESTMANNAGAPSATKSDEEMKKEKEEKEEKEAKRKAQEEQDEKDDKDKKKKEKEEEDEEEDEKETKKSARKSSAAAADPKEVAMLCDLAGRTDLLAGFITQGTPVAEVRKQLLAARASKEQEAGSIAHNVPGIVGKKITDQLEDMARTRAAAQGIPYAQAYTLVLKENPRLYTNYLDQRDNIARFGAPSQPVA